MPRALDRCTKLLALATALLLTHSAPAQTTPTTLPADCTAYASVPLPAEAANATAPKTPPACASYRSYRGIGRPVNYAEARACAWQERLAKQADLGQNPNEPTSWVVGGPLILADLYANAAGVPRNLPLAMRFACEFEDQTAMLALPEMQKLEASRQPRNRFELCDYAATTFTETFCGGYQAEAEDDRRTRYYDTLKLAMPSDQRAAFEKLLSAEHAYINAHASEVYQGGSIHNIRTLTSQEILEHLFQAELKQYEHRHWPGVTANQIKDSYPSLQREYEDKLRDLQSRPVEQGDEGAAVTPQGLTEAQQAWQHYRDAWATFARLRYPTHAEAIAAQITLDRYRLLKTI